MANDLIHQAPLERAEKHREKMRGVAERISRDVDSLAGMVQVAVTERHHEALGYGPNGWAKYLAETFEGIGAGLDRIEKRGLVQALASVRDDDGRAMGKKAIAKVASLAVSTVQVHAKGVTDSNNPPTAYVALDGRENTGGGTGRPCKGATENVKSQAGKVSREIATLLDMVSEDADATEALVLAAWEAHETLTAFLREHGALSEPEPMIVDAEVVEPKHVDPLALTAEEEAQGWYLPDNPPPRLEAVLETQTETEVVEPKTPPRRPGYGKW